MLQEFGPSLHFADGPTVPFFGFPYPTRMALAKLPDGGLWAWSPVALTEELDREVEALGPLRHIVSPNKLHHLFLRPWSERWPDARVNAPPRPGPRRAQAGARLTARGPGAVQARKPRAGGFGVIS